MLIVARRQSHLVFWVVNFLLVGSNSTFHAVVDAGKHYLDSIKGNSFFQVDNGRPPSPDRL